MRERANTQSPVDPATELTASKRLNEVPQQQLAGMKEGARAEADAKAALGRSSALELSKWVAADGYFAPPANRLYKAGGKKAPQEKINSRRLQGLKSSSPTTETKGRWPVRSPRAACAQLGL